MKHNGKFLRWGVEFTTKAIRVFKNSDAEDSDEEADVPDEDDTETGSGVPPMSPGDEALFHDIVTLQMDLLDKLTALSIQQEFVRLAHFNLKTFDAMMSNDKFPYIHIA
jgi:hypothetical protein